MRSFVRWFWEKKAVKEISKLKNFKILEVGSATNSFSKHFHISNRLICSDIKPSEGIIKEDVRSLSFPHHYLDCIVCFNVLEHVFELDKAIKELDRVLKPGGILLIKTPFMYPLHDAPNDYWRFTGFALERLFEKIGSVKVEPILFNRFSFGHFVVVNKDCLGKEEIEKRLKEMKP